MSNVLIGIIGVILFIGLALAGALFLGPRFQESTNNSKASATVQHMHQIASAMNLHGVNEGRAILSSEYNNGSTTLFSAGYLKPMPGNPLNGRRYNAVDDAGTGSATPVKFIYTDLGGDDAAQRVCRAIEAMSGASDPDANTKNVVGWTPTAQNKRPGCVRLSATEYDAYIPV